MVLCFFFGFVGFNECFFFFFFFVGECFGFRMIFIWWFLVLLIRTNGVVAKSPNPPKALGGAWCTHKGPTSGVGSAKSNEVKGCRESHLDAKNGGKNG